MEINMNEATLYKACNWVGLGFAVFGLLSEMPIVAISGLALTGISMTLYIVRIMQLFK